MNGGQRGGRLSDLVSRLSQRIARSDEGKRGVVAGPRPAAVSAETVVASKTLTAFLSLVFSRPAAVLVDLGPVVGSNIAFLGERIGCKIYVEDLYADLDRHAQQGALDRLPEFLEKRLALPDESVDAVLGWDVVDYLAPAAASVLAGEVLRVLRPGGALLAFFGGSRPGDMRYTKYVFEDEAHIRYRFYAGACGRQPVLQNRDIIKLFAGLDVSDSVLLKSGLREVLFRKPIG